jgi:hypothetical protein
LSRTHVTAGPSAKLIGEFRSGVFVDESRQRDSDALNDGVRE